MEPQTQIWNPDKRLNINAFANNDMFCVGMAVTRGNARCRWRITGDQHSKVCALLDKIGKEEPMEMFNSNDLLRLAKLSLCEERHQYQMYDIVGRWNNVIQNITEEYTEIKEIEEVKELKTRNLELRTNLTKEREERQQLEALHSRCPSIFRQGREEAEARAARLSAQVEEVEHSLAESREQAERLALQKGQLSRQLEEMRRTSAQKVDGLDSQLSAHKQMSEQLRQELETTTANRGSLQAQIESLKAQSATESESLKQLKRDLNKAETAQAALLKEKEKFESLLAAERQTSSQLGKNLESERQTSGQLGKKLESERQTSGQLGKKLKSLEAELALAQGTLERTQLDLAQSRKVNEEQAAADAAYRAASTVETARLEEQSQASFLRVLIGRIKGRQSTPRSGRRVGGGRDEGTGRK